LPIRAETCPQYCSHEDSLEADRGGEVHLQPAAARRSQPQAVWDSLENGTFDIVSSDQRAFRFGGARASRLPAPGAPFDKVPNGIPGLETRMAL